MSKKQKEWNEVYKKGQTPWDIGMPSPELVSFLNSKWAKNLKMKDKKRALDVCSGTGDNSIHLESKGLEVVGIDISSVAIEKARRKIKGQALKIKFIEGDILNSSLIPGTFDFVFDRGCFHHQWGEEREQYVKLVSDKLKKGGFLLLLTICDKDKSVSGPNKVSKEDIVKYFSKNFEIIEIKDSILKDRAEPRIYTSILKRK